MKKVTVFLKCEGCGNIFLSTNLVVAERSLVCGQGCGGELKSVSKTEAYTYFQEKIEDEKKV